MITQSQAYKNMISHMERTPIQSLLTIDEMIRVSSLMGHETISFFVKNSDVSSFVKELRKSKFHVTVVCPQSLSEESLITVDWNTAQFIGTVYRSIDE